MSVPVAERTEWTCKITQITDTQPICRAAWRAAQAIAPSFKSGQVPSVMVVEDFSQRSARINASDAEAEVDDKAYYLGTGQWPSREPHL